MPTDEQQISQQNATDSLSLRNDARHTNTGASKADSVVGNTPGTEEAKEDVQTDFGKQDSKTEAPVETVVEPKQKETVQKQETSQPQDNAYMEVYAAKPYFQRVQADTFDLNNIWIPDTMFLTSKELPRMLLTKEALDSCLKSENFEPPVLLKPTEYKGSESIINWNEISKQLNDISRTVPIIGKQKTATVKPSEIYIGKDGTRLNSGMADTWWLTPLMFICFFVAGIVVSMYHKAISSDTKNFFGRAASSGNTNTTEHKSSHRLLLALLWTVTLPIYGMLAREELSYSLLLHPGWALGSGIVICMVYLLLKHMLSSYVAYLYASRGALELWNNGFNYTTSISGLALLAVDLMMAYGQISLGMIYVKAGVVAIVLPIIAFIIYQIAHFSKGLLSCVYLFLYLCTSEILPAIALYIGLAYAIGLA